MEQDVNQLLKIAGLILVLIIAIVFAIWFGGAAVAG